MDDSINLFYIDSISKLLSNKISLLINYKEYISSLHLSVWILSYFFIEICKLTKKLKGKKNLKRIKSDRKIATNKNKFKDFEI